VSDDCRQTDPADRCGDPGGRDHGASWASLHAEMRDVDELSASVFRGFMRVLHLHRQYMFRAFAVHGAHPGQAICLRLLAAHDGITQCDLAREMHLARPTVTKMLQAMEREGLVERRPDERDQRLMHVHLTPAGVERAKDVFRAAADYVDKVIGRLSEDDRRELVRLFDALADGMQADAAPERDEAAGKAAGEPA